MSYPSSNDCKASTKHCQASSIVLTSSSKGATLTSEIKGSVPGRAPGGWRRLKALRASEERPMDWLWQNLFSTLVWEILLVIGGATVLGYLKRNAPDQAPTIAYSVFGATCVAILLFTFTGRGLLSRRPPEVTAENLEENIRKWAENNGLSIAKVSSTVTGQNVYFGFVITLPSRNQIMVFRGKEKSTFIQMQSPLVLSQEHLTMLNKLSKEQADDAIEEVTLEMNRARIGFIMAMQTALIPPMIGGTAPTTKPSMFGQTIIVSKTLAMTEANEVNLLDKLNQIDSEVGIVRGITDLTLKRYSRMQQIDHAVQH